MADIHEDFFVWEVTARYRWDNQLHNFDTYVDTVTVVQYCNMPIVLDLGKKPERRRHGESLTLQMKYAFSHFRYFFVAQEFILKSSPIENFWLEIRVILLSLLKTLIMSGQYSCHLFIQLLLNVLSWKCLTYGDYMVVSKLLFSSPELAFWVRASLRDWRELVRARNVLRRNR